MPSHPQISPSGPPHQPRATPLPLMSLQDLDAPYKGVWQLLDGHHDGFEAVHCTYLRPDGLGCEIERRRFSARSGATDFAHHLITHGWCIREIQHKAEHFWFGLPDRAQPRRPV